MLKYITLIIAILAVALWSWLAGSLTPQVIEVDPQASLYDTYLTFNMEEDGSYTAVTRSGERVTGCIDKALCNNQ